MQEQQRIMSFSEKCAVTLIIGAVFLAPLFFMPLLSFQFGKVFIISLAVLLALVGFFISVIKQKAFVVPKTLFFLAAALVPLIFFVASFFSSPLANIHVSLIGYGFEVATASFMALMFATLLILVSFFKNKERVFSVYLALFASMLLVSLFQILHLVAPGFITFGSFLSPVDNLIGKWNDLGIFFAIGALVSAITLESISLSKFFKNTLRIVFVVSLFFLALVNFTTLWVLLGVSALLYMLYSWKLQNSEVSDSTPPAKKLSKYALAIIILAIIAVPSYAFIGSKTSALFNVSYFEAKPDWTATLSIAKLVSSQSLLFGTGPNRFINAWYDFKPTSVNSTAFWNTDFDFAAGFIPTLMISTGLLGSLAILFFLGTFAISAFRAFRLTVPDQFSRYLLISSLLTSIFLWLVSIFYSPGALLVFLTYVFTGLFFASYYSLGNKPTWTLSFATSRKTFFSGLFVVVTVLVLLWAGTASAKALSSIYFQKGVAEFGQTGDVDQAALKIQKAISLSPNDIYYRALTELYLFKLNGIVDGTIKPQTTVEADAKLAFDNAVKFGGEAVLRNPRNYYNWTTLGSVYETVVPAGVEQAFENAFGAYTQAVLANPSNPANYLILARLHATSNDYVKAKEFIAEALRVKPNYTQAVFLLSQIEIQLGNLKAAITAVQSASDLEPNNATTHFQLGFLKYNDKDYRGAVAAFDKAIGIVSDYANAKYFRGLSYVSLGDDEKALADFTDIEKSNPDNAEVKLIISNVKAGRGPFVNAQPPVDDKPESRTTLPVSEN